VEANPLQWSLGIRNEVPTFVIAGALPYTAGSRVSGGTVYKPEAVYNAATGTARPIESNIAISPVRYSL
jgi:hypothetical protein